MNRKPVTATLCATFGLLSAGVAFAADDSTATPGAARPDAKAHVEAKHAHQEAKEAHNGAREERKDAKEARKDAKPAQKRKLPWADRRHMKHDTAEHGEDASKPADAAEGAEPAAGDEPKSDQ